MAITPRYGNTVLKKQWCTGYGCHDGYGPRDFRHASADSRTLSGVYQLLWRTQRKAELTTAQLTLITDEGSVNEKQETFIVPMRNAGELTLVKSFDW